MSCSSALLLLSLLLFFLINTGIYTINKKMIFFNQGIYTIFTNYETSNI